MWLSAAETISSHGHRNQVSGLYHALDVTYIYSICIIDMRHIHPFSHVWNNSRTCLVWMPLWNMLSCDQQDQTHMHLFIFQMIVSLIHQVTDIQMFEFHDFCADVTKCLNRFAFSQINEEDRVIS